MGYHIEKLRKGTSWPWLIIFTATDGKRVRLARCQSKADAKYLIWRITNPL